jgi:hypothetical protein
MARSNRVPQTGARRGVLGEDDWEAAEEAYASFRGRSDDVATIPKNTGLREAQVARIKNHLMVKDDHILWEGVGKLDADPMIVNAWNRMLSGKATATDLQLMVHEYLESRMEGIFKATVDAAHKAVSKRHPSGL